MPLFPRSLPRPGTGACRPRQQIGVTGREWHLATRRRTTCESCYSPEASSSPSSRLPTSARSFSSGNAFLAKVNGHLVPYCHVVVHWNLPNNPVDLEQREGRVHRYKGHAIRKNVALKHGAGALADGGDVWATAFGFACHDRLETDSELVPY